MNTLNIDDEWNTFINKGSGSDDEEIIDTKEIRPSIFEGVAPEPTDIYISTKSKIAYLTEPIDLNIFWDIPIIRYSTPTNGVIKKQIKLNSKSNDEVNVLYDKLNKELYYEDYVISHIDNPSGRIKFKDIRKITIGLSKKDIMTYRSKKKQAFYNCFVMILRIKIDDIFKEFHIKVFNTGKLEIPGVQSEPIFEIVLKNIKEILQKYHIGTIDYKHNSDTVLINSNFNCKFYIEREVLFDILREKYHIHALYDPCSYPGIQCKFYYNTELSEQTGIQPTLEMTKHSNNIVAVSFMIFRTGSVLIVGMCDEYILHNIYGFLINLLKTEFKYICQQIITDEYNVNKNKTKKIRKRIINIIPIEQQLVDEDNV